jgi:ComF family protein
VAALTRERPRPSPSSPEFPDPRTLLRRAAGDVLEFLLPQRCPGCGVPADPARLLCEACVARLPALDVPICARCLRDGGAADGCVRHAGDRVHAAWIYDERVAAVVHALKFGGRPGLARAHVGAIVRALPEKARRADLVTGVPLHATRLRERGDDQAARLGEALADAIGTPFVRVLRRVRATRAQSGLGPDERRVNVRSAFQLTHAAWIEGRSVLLVDDVLTTGATMTEALATLRAAGARTVGAALAWAQ